MAQRPLFIHWQAQNETGIAIIDEQHKGIVSIINTFYYLMGTGANNTMLFSSISGVMKTYSRIHFITEERLLAAAYKDYEKHKELHRQLLLEIERIEYEAVMANDAKPLLDFLKKWWLEHINEQDRLYVAELRASINAMSKK